MRPPATLDLKHQQAPLLRADKGHAVKAALKDKEMKPTLTSLALSTVSLDSKAPRTNGSFQRTFLQPTSKGLDDLEPCSYVTKKLYPSYLSCFVADGSLFLILLDKVVEARHKL